MLAVILFSPPATKLDVAVTALLNPRACVLDEDANVFELPTAKASIEPVISFPCPNATD